MNHNDELCNCGSEKTFGECCGAEKPKTAEELAEELSGLRSAHETVQRDRGQMHETIMRLKMDLYEAQVLLNRLKSPARILANLHVGQQGLEGEAAKTILDVLD